MFRWILFAAIIIYIILVFIVKLFGKISGDEMALALILITILAMTKETEEWD